MISVSRSDIANTRFLASNFNFLSNRCVFSTSNYLSTRWERYSNRMDRLQGSERFPNLDVKKPHARIQPSILRGSITSWTIKVETICRCLKPRISPPFAGRRENLVRKMTSQRRPPIIYICKLIIRSHPHHPLPLLPRKLIPRVVRALAYLFFETLDLPCAPPPTRRLIGGVLTLADQWWFN